MASRLSLVSLILLFMAAACAKPPLPHAAPLAPQPTMMVQTQQGDVIGGASPNGARTWLGIPYASPPVGQLRWRPTEPPMPRSETLSALQHASWCPQITNGLDSLMGIEKGTLRGDEDCLYLDIYAPSDAKASSALPVMVWIHGGSNVWGRAEQYDASKLAEAGDVVVVVVQYRLGPLGWFAHPALEDGIANFALLDLVQALRWTRNNIAAFGGDPDAVTLFGESAGANNVLALLAMPAADGLYRAAVAQSGLPASFPLDIARDGRGLQIVGAIPAGQAFTEHMEPDAAALRAAPLEAIFDAYRSGRTPAVIRDDITLADQPLADAITAHQAGRNLPLIIGSNRDEAKYLLAFDPAMTRKALFLFPVARDADHYEAVSRYMSGVWRAIGVSGFAQQLAEAGTGPVRTYRFDWDEGARVGLSDLGQLVGAAHSLEIPFVFGHFENFMGRLDKRLFTRRNADGRMALSQAMMACWTRFATGGPDALLSGGTCPAWQAIDASDRQATMVFDTPQAGGSGMKAETGSITNLMSELAADPVLDQNNRRCELAASLTRMFGQLRPGLAAELTAECPE
ncbi:carboxylesterase family protein [Henriciella mobilis]|uniref:carboxylesterase family protein n=1 Tax=Henriciella mobilis TaxID=2305467 RepID=UPI001314B7E7|nr:carboxylesterase family protein [Henriciella mobilis]